MRPLLLQQVALAALRYAGEVLSVPGVRLPSLLNPKPVAGDLSHWVNWDGPHRNVDDGHVGVLSIVATASRSGRSVAFCAGAAARIAGHRSRVIDYAPARICVEHVQASAAIPDPVPAGRGCGSRRRRAGDTSTAALGSTRRSSPPSTWAPIAWWCLHRLRLGAVG